MRGDIGFVRDCDGTGTQLIDNTYTATDCVSFYTTGTAAWQGHHYIEFGIPKAVNKSLRARITATVEDIPEE